MTGHAAPVIIPPAPSGMGRTTSGAPGSAMAIQFQCTGCSQPIEVDDEFAGRAAACPYCRRVVTIPTRSTLEPQAVVTARGLSDTQATLPPAIDPTRILARQQAASYGNYALICTVLTLTLCGVFFVRTITIAAQSGILKPGATPTVDDQKRLMELAGRDAWIIGPVYGALFFSLFGLGLGVASIRRSARSNWRGILASVVCGLYVLCQCGGIVLAGAELAAPGG
jgi:DNA-directed RNA polymerase subunit RPC12/RpoP